MMPDPPPRNFLAEAFAIMRGESCLLPERRHLDALDEHYQRELIRLVYDIEQVTKAALKRN